MDDNEAIKRELVFYLSECLDFYIKSANCSKKDIQEDDMNLKALYYILSSLHQMGVINPDESKQ